MTVKAPTITLSDGLAMPRLGYGTYQVSDHDAEDAVGYALDVGYQLIDTASFYGNENGVGRALKGSDIPRDQLYITSKVWNNDHGRDATLRACEASLGRLGLDFLDLYLIHWPQPQRELYVETWETLIELQQQGLVKSIGVANFEPSHVEAIVSATGVVPVVNQVECHPYLAQVELRGWLDSKNIVCQSWAPLGRGKNLLTEDAITGLASELDATPAQIVIAWHLASGNACVPKTANPARMVENFSSIDITLTAQQLVRLNVLDSGLRMGPHPDEFHAE